MKTMPHSAKGWLESAFWTLLLGALFFFVYGTCNWITSLRTDVGTFYFDWEKWIPFVPVMIIPYMSIDLFFAGGPFLCRNRSELHTLATRIIFAIGISAIGFLLFPLKFAFIRPEVGGWLGSMFAPLNAFDQPFNLAPSLHISLRSILWPIYARRIGDRWRPLLQTWFVLIGVSTLLVYQHHFVDIIAGNIAALLVFYLVPEKHNVSKQTSLAPKIKTASAYASIAIVAAILAVTATRFNLLFIWITAAMAILGWRLHGTWFRYFSQIEWTDTLAHSTAPGSLLFRRTSFISFLYTITTCLGANHAQCFCGKEIIKS